MQKIDVKIFDKKEFNELKTNEITVLLYIVKHMNVHGVLENLSYRFVTQETGMSKQTFYQSLRGLETLGFISVNFLKNNEWGYYNVRIIDCDYSNVKTKEDYKNKPYISTNKYAFLYTQEFIKLSASNKRLILSIIRRLGGYKRVRLSMDNLMSISNVISRRSVFKFLANARKWFNISKVKGKSTYIFSVCNKTFDTRDSFSESENETMYQLKIKCYKNKVDYTSNDLIQTVKLYTHNKYYEKYKDLFQGIVEKVIETKGKLEYKLINWTLQYALKKNGIKKKISKISESEQAFIEQVQDWLGDREEFFIPFSIA